MPRKATSKKEPTTKKMLSWRENDDVIQTAVNIAEERELSKQAAFSLLFRNGIALYDLEEEVRAHLKEKRIEEVERLEASPNPWIRKQAQSLRTMATLYAPTDSEVIEFIRLATQERMYGRFQREEEAGAVARDEQGQEERTASFPEHMVVMYGQPPIDEDTAVIAIGSSVIAPGGADVIAVQLANYRGDGTSLLASLKDDGLHNAIDVPREQRAEPDSSVVSIQHDLAFTIAFEDGGAKIQRAPLDPSTGEYEHFATVGRCPGLRKPSAFVVMWLDGGIRIDRRGITCFRCPSPADVDADQVVVQQAGNTFVYTHGEEEIQVLHA